MNTKSIKHFLSLGICLLSVQSMAQNGTSKSRPTTKVNTKINAQNSVKSQSKNLSPDQVKLKSIYDFTTERLKSPNRLQKMGGMDGGGGNALLCKDDSKFTLKLLDTYEAKELGIKIESNKSDFKEIIEDSLNNLKAVSPARAAAYGSYVKRLLTSDAQWVENKVMPVIDDVKLATFPYNCLLVQVAVQRPIEQSTVPNAKTYIINQDLFQLLTPIDKAALILHEILYRESKFSGHENSIFTRHLVGLIMSGNVRKYSLRDLNDLYKKNNILCREQLSSGSIQPVFGHTGGAYCIDYYKNINFSSSNKIELKTPQNWPKKTDDISLSYTGSLISNFTGGLFKLFPTFPENINLDSEKPIEHKETGLLIPTEYLTTASEIFEANGNFTLTSHDFKLPSMKFKGHLTFGFIFNQGYLPNKNLSLHEESNVDIFNQQSPFHSVMRMTSPESRNLGYRFSVLFKGDIQLNSNLINFVKQKCSDIDDSCLASISFTNKTLTAHDGAYFLINMSGEGNPQSNWVKGTSVTFDQSGNLKVKN